MALVDSSSAVTAKARSKYGKRLKTKDYQAMVKCSDVSEVVQYLKTYTHYHEPLDKISLDVHRGNLEAIIRDEMFESFLSLCKYCTADSPMASFIVRRVEIRELMKFITLLSIKRPMEYIFSLSIYFNKHTDIDLTKLSYVTSYTDLLEVLRSTPYRKIITQFPPDENAIYDLPAIEDALNNYNAGQLYEDLKKIKNKKDRQQIKDLFDTLIDYNNYSRINRLKKYFNMSNDEVREHLIHFGYLTGKRLDRILSKEEFDEVYAALERTSVGKRAKTIDKESEMAVQGRYERCRHELYFSSNSEIVLLAYYIISETELSNVIAIIEGVRYQMPPERITENLIL